MSYQPHPLRIQRKRTAGWRMPEGAIYCGRPTIWGNPWSTEKAMASGLFKPEFVAEVVVNEYRAWLLNKESPFMEHCGYRHTLHYRRGHILEHLHELKGKQLACWCGLDKPCHVDVLAELANR